MRVSLIGLGASALLLSACASAGTSFDWETARKITVGTTEAELLAIMGKPNSVVTRGDQQVWSWIYVYSGFMSHGNRHVSFPLKDGKVTAVPNLAPLQ